MGVNYSGGCCTNIYTDKNEADLDLLKRDMSKLKNRKTLITINEGDEDAQGNAKNRRNKEFLEKHIKDNSKYNSFSASRAEYQEKLTKLNEIVKNQSSVLKLKVLNSNSNLTKGTTILMNCQGLIMNETNENKRNAKDGFAYFGYSPNNLEKELKELDYNIHFAKGINEKNEQSNM